MSKKLCKGCSTQLRCPILNIKISAKHAMKVWEQLPNCPCNQCIVKPMCLETCEAYIQFSDKIQTILIHGDNVKKVKWIKQMNV